MNYPATTRLSQRLMNSKNRFLGDGTGALRLAGGSLVLISALTDHHEREIIGRTLKSPLLYRTSRFRLFSNSSQIARADYQNRL